MSKASQRPSREAIKEQRCHKKQQEKALRKQQKDEGLIPRTAPALPNACSPHTTKEEEQQEREEAVTGQLRLLRRELPELLQRLNQIPDPRHAWQAQAQIDIADGLRIIDVHLPAWL